MTVLHSVIVDIKHDMVGHKGVPGGMESRNGSRWGATLKNFSSNFPKSQHT